jgi:hypothetical protein
LRGDAAASGKLFFAAQRSRSPERIDMRGFILTAAALIAAAATAGAANAAVKKVAYPEVKINVTSPYEPEPGFQAMWKALGDAVAAKDTAALTALVGPMFIWTSQGTMIDQLDPGRDAVHNFKVVFGFRGAGKSEDGGVDNGPYWDMLAGLLTDATFYKLSALTSEVCGPMQAEVADQDRFEAAQKKIANGDDFGDWYFIAPETAVAKAPNDTGPPVAKISKIAVPMVGSFPMAKPGQPEPQPTHAEILLPTGKTGWVPIAALRPFDRDRLCFAQTADGQWKIVGYDESGQDD